MFSVNIMASLTLHQGDCLAVMKDISANSIDLIICDLPYGCLSTSKAAKINRADYPDRPNHRTEENNLGGCTWDIKINLEKFWEQARRILRDDHSPVIHFCTTKFGYELIKSNESWFRYDLVWDKGHGVSFLSANRMPMRSHEMIYVFSKAGAKYNRVDIKGDFKGWSGTGASAVYNIKARNTGKTGGNGTRCVLSVVKMINNAKKGNHPTEKPVELYRWLIERYSAPGGTVLDPTFGSGNSVFTAFDMGRNAIGIEKDEAFYEKAASKINVKNEII